MREARRPDTTFWVEVSAVDGDRLALGKEESHHLLRVHRASVGTPFEAVDGAGGSYECVVESTRGGIAVGRIVKVGRGEGELHFPIALLVGLPDSGPVEAVVIHAVPLGATTIDFMACARSTRPPIEPKGLARLGRLARSALKQSRRSRLPEIRSSASLKAAVEAVGPGLRFFADVHGGPRIAAPPDRIQSLVSLAVGPPGGFDGDEVGLLRTSEFSPISLGPSRLSTETAAITLIALARNSL